jgi:L,D-peptidoglycan transpeptidase YkuD (ErfK/YbiS/YcfS/YnhG family)
MFKGKSSAYSALHTDEPGTSWRMRKVAGWISVLVIGAAVGGWGLKEVWSTANAADGKTAKQLSTGLPGTNAILAAFTPDSANQTDVLKLEADSLRDIVPQLGLAEARLIEIYQLIGNGEPRQALAKAESLVKDHPNFQLAQLVYGDLLSLQVRPVRQLGDVAEDRPAVREQLRNLREESRRRLRALAERPPEGAIPTQFLALSNQSRHAIAVDANRSRLYLFENVTPAQAQDTPPQLKLVADFYISVGLSGIDKWVEGDKRTPLGVYYITSSLNPQSLPDLYGVGALPINYPNALDVQRGKTGSGIWLHGTPREQFVRAPQASDGCVVLSNPDLERVLSIVRTRTTPVIIASELHWTTPQALQADRENFEIYLRAWQNARVQGDLDGLKDLYSERFQAQGRKLGQWWPKVESEVRAGFRRPIEIKDLSVLRWRDSDDTMVVTFGEVPVGQTTGVTRRQYWIREGGDWRIFFEGNA